MKKDNKKAQLKIQEMSFMLVALVLFFIIVGLFYITLSSTELQRSYEEGSREEAIFLISKVVEGPEMSYGSGTSADADKLVVLKERYAYEDFWPVDSLVVKRLYPYSNKTIECSAGIYDNCNTFTIKEGKGKCWTTPYSSFIAICRKEFKSGYDYDKCDIGIIEACPKGAD